MEHRIAEEPGTRFVPGLLSHTANNGKNGLGPGNEATVHYVIRQIPLMLSHLTGGRSW